MSVSSVVEHILSAMKVWGSIPRPFNSETVSPMVRYCCEVSSGLHCPGAETRR